MGIIYPGAVVFVNADLVDQVRTHIVKQLHINEVISGITFDARVAADANYVSKVKQLSVRILVERPYTELENRTLADIVIFVKNGLAANLKGGVGPPTQTYPVLNLHYGQFCLFL